MDVKQHSAQQAESRTVAKLGSDSRVSCMPASPRKVLLFVVVAVVVLGAWGWKRKPQLSQFLSNFKPACYFETLHHCPRPDVTHKKKKRKKKVDADQ